MHRHRIHAFLGIIACLIAVLLWVAPPALFGKPGPNDAIDLSGYGPAVLLAVLGVSLFSLIPVRKPWWSVEVPVALGSLSMGAGLSAVLGLVSFGNLQDDRFMPLFLLPWLCLPVGAAVLAIALAARTGARGNVRVAVLRAILGIFVIGIWLLARGARDWLLAPYGFDWFLIIAEAAAVLIIVSVAPNRRAGGRV